MQIIRKKRMMGLLICLALIFVLSVSTSLAQEKIKITGKGTYTYTDRPAFKFDDTEDHIIFISRWEGVNFSTGENKFMDGAEVVFISYGDYVKGNGPFWGYIKMSLNGDVIFSKFKGKTTTAPSPKGKPITVFEGVISFTKGTGQFANIQGGSSFKNTMISRTIMVSQWAGEYFIKE